MTFYGCKCPVCTALPESGAVTTWTVPAPAPSRPAVLGPTIFDLVKADLDERDRIGAAQHGGKPLKAQRCLCEHDWDDHDSGTLGQAGTEWLCSRCNCDHYSPAKDFLREAYDEALDLCVYLRGALAEREDKIAGPWLCDACGHEPPSHYQDGDAKLCIKCKRDCSGSMFTRVGRKEK